MGQIEYSPSTDKFGKVVVKYFRDEMYQSYIDIKKRIIEKGDEKYINEINPNLCDEYKQLEIERAKFFCSLTQEQNETLDKLILNTLDSTTFNIMRALDENCYPEETGVELRIDGIEARRLKLIGNGMLSGEIFDWFPRFSKFGQCQF